MLYHHLRLARRGISRNKSYTAINVLGLTFGMLAALIIAKYVGATLQFDSFHESKDHIYAIGQQESVRGNPQKESQSTYWGVGDLLGQYPEVLATTRYSYHVSSLVIAYPDGREPVSFLENRIFSADSGFLNIFTFPLIKGDRNTVLSRPDAIVLTRSAAKRFFGDTDPLGKTLRLRTTWGLETVHEITGVAEDIPSRSQFRFDFLIAQQRPDPDDPWYSPDYSTFALVKDDFSDADLLRKLADNLATAPQLKNSERTVIPNLRPLTENALSSAEYLLIAIAIFVVIISWTNYINQLIAQSYARMKAMGILTVIGASRSNLHLQFMVESALVCLTSLILVIGLYIALEPQLQTLTDGHLLPLWNDPTPLNFVFFGIFLGGIVWAGIIPNIIFFAQDFGSTLRHAFNRKVGGIALRKRLVVVQFSISVVLVISVVVISRQLHFLQKQDKGVDMSDVLVIRSPIVRDTTWNVKRKTVGLFKEKCAELPFVLDAASSTSVPGEEYRWETYLSFQDGNQTMVHQNGVDERFFDLYDVVFLAGHNYVPDARWKNRRSIILNESAAHALGIVDFDAAIDNKVTDHESGEEYDLIGIVKDYHQTSLKYKIKPIAFRFNDFWGHFSLKVDHAQFADQELTQNASTLLKIWERIYPDASFDYFLLDEQYATQDRADQNLGRLFNSFAALSVAISCMGLFSLSLLVSTKRQKEIGIRKVFGASSWSVLTTFVSGYVGSLVVAMAIGTPLAYQLMRMWLVNFAYHADIKLTDVIAALVGLSLLFMTTVAYHTIRSAGANPVKVLRD